MSSRSRKLLAVVMATAPALAGCRREARPFDLMSVAMGPARGAYDEGNAYAVAEGKRLFTQFNCVGCHAHGGGGIGPPLMDATWRYGGSAAQIFQTIARGRPNGMPAFGRLPDSQLWQLVAYVRSMSGLLPKDVAPGRDDAMQVRSAEQATARAAPRP